MLLFFLLCFISGINHSNFLFFNSVITVFFFNFFKYITRDGFNIKKSYKNGIAFQKYLFFLRLSVLLTKIFVKFTLIFKY